MASRARCNVQAHWTKLSFGDSACGLWHFARVEEMGYAALG